MKQFKLLSVLVVFLISTNLLAQKSNKIPVTSENKEALKLFNESLLAVEKVQFNSAVSLLEKAIETDPDFFMPHFQLAVYNLFLFNNEEKFKKYATKAIAIEKKLNDAEELYKKMLTRLLIDKKSDLTIQGEKIVKLYPKDPYSYSYQAFFLTRQERHEEALKMQKQALKYAKNKAQFYNAIGYNYMAVNKMKEAEKAFDKYIQMEPELANPYDSKGDYYMAIKDYKKAQESFMKAYTIDNVNFAYSKEKAKKAKKMIESGGKN